MKKEFYSGRLYADSIDEIPEGEHWVIMENQSFTIPGDERSRTNPGHGYPEHTEHFLTMIVFETKEDMTSHVYDLGKCLGQKKDYKILFIRTPKVTTTIQVEVE